MSNFADDQQKTLASGTINNVHVQLFQSFFIWYTYFTANNFKEKLQQFMVI